MLSALSKQTFNPWPLALADPGVDLNCPQAVIAASVLHPSFVSIWLDSQCYSIAQQQINSIQSSQKVWMFHRLCSLNCCMRKCCLKQSGLYRLLGYLCGKECLGQGQYPSQSAWCYSHISQIYPSLIEHALIICKRKIITSWGLGSRKKIC